MEEALGDVARADSIEVLSAVARVHAPIKALWSVCKELDSVVPREVLINFYTPEDVALRLLPNPRERLFPVVKVLLGVEAQERLERQGIQEGEEQGEDESALVGEEDIADDFPPEDDIVDDFDEDFLGIGVGDALKNDRSVGSALTRLPPKLKELRFARYFDGPVEFPEECVIESIIFGDMFNQPVAIPPGTKSVEFDDTHRFNSDITLPNGLRRLVFHASSPFNRPLALPASVKEVQLGRGFNHPLDLPAGLEVLSICDCEEIVWNRESVFNQPVLLPASIKEVHLGHAYNQPLDLPEGIQRVSFSRISLFDQPLHLPSSLLSIEFGYAFNKRLHLNDGLETLKFCSAGCRVGQWREGFGTVKNSKFNQPLTFPESMKVVVLGHSYNQPLNGLPKGLQALTVGDSFRQPLRNLPAGLQSFTVGEADGLLTTQSGEEHDVSTLPFDEWELPLGLKRLAFEGLFNQPVSLPAHVAEVSFGDAFDQSVRLPSSGNLKILTFGRTFNQPLPSLAACVGLEELRFGANFNQPVVLPSGLKHVEFRGIYQKPVKLPEGMLSATFWSRYHESVEMAGEESWTCSIEGFLKVYRRDVGV